MDWHKKINAPAFSFTQMNESKQDYAYSEVWIPVKENR